MITGNLRRFGPFTFDTGTRELTKFGLKIKFEEKPALLLCYLLEHAGEPVSRETLQRVLWPDGIHTDYDHGLNKCVNKLRLALGESASKPQFVETLSKQGYRFIGRVEVCDPTVDPSKNGVHHGDRSQTAAPTFGPESLAQLPIKKPFRSVRRVGPM